MTDRFETAFAPPPSDKDRAIQFARYVLREAVNKDSEQCNLARQLLRALCLSEVG